MHSVNFKLDGTDGAARATTFTTVHGSVQTPVFMPVGTQGAIRAVSPQHVMQTNPDPAGKYVSSVPASG